MQTTASVVRLQDDEAVAARGTSYASTFADVRKCVAPPLDRLVDACVSILGQGPNARTTPIQSECWAILLGPQPVDVIGISATGSGKTLAFLLPAFASLLQEPTTEGGGIAAAPADGDEE